jgi:hypothetical protein
MKDKRSRKSDLLLRRAGIAESVVHLALGAGVVGGSRVTLSAFSHVYSNLSNEKRKIRNGM